MNNTPIEKIDTSPDREVHNINLLLAEKINEIIDYLSTVERENL